MSRSWLIVGLTVVLWGCAAHGLVQQGDNAAARGDWVSAYISYRDASMRRPGNAKMADQANQARVNALQIWHDLYDQAVAKKDLRSAFNILLDAHDAGPKEEWVRLGFNTVVRKRNGQTDQLLASGQLDEAYQLAVETRTWFPDRDRVQQRVDAAREALIADARALARSGDFSRAKRRAASILQFEPAQTTLVSEIEQELSAAWASRSRRSATEATRRGRYGEALALTALITTLATDRADQDALQLARERFLAREGLVFDVRVRGADNRARPLRQQLALQVARSQGVSWNPDTLHPTVGGELRLFPPQCEQTSSRRRAEHLYVAGVVQVPNPAFVRLEREADTLEHNLRLARRELRGAEVELDEARASLEYARADVVPVERQLYQTQHELDEAIASENQAIQAVNDATLASEEVESYRQVRGTLQERLRVLRAQLGERRATLRQAKLRVVELERGQRGDTPSPELELARKQASDAEAELEATRNQLSAVQESLAALRAPSELVRRLANELPARTRALEQERRPQVEQRYHHLEHQLNLLMLEVSNQEAAVSSRHETYNRLLGRARQARSDVDSVHLDLQRTPPTQGEQVFDTYVYTIERWTRSCTVRAELNTRSSVLPNLHRSFSFTYETADDTHEPVPGVGLPGDALVFPSTDAELVRRGDDDLRKAVVPLLMEQVGAWRDQRLQRGERSNVSEGRTRGYLAAYYVDPSAVPTGMAGFMKRTYGLEDLSALTK